METSVVGDLINFRGLVYSPMNENGVVFLFGKVVEDRQHVHRGDQTGLPGLRWQALHGKGMGTGVD